MLIGRRTSRISEDDALDVVSGYVCFNDVSARDLQFADEQWVRGKSLDTFAPVGPRVVPASEIADPQRLSIRTSVNGVTLQDSSTAQMVFGVAQLIAFISEAITLESGDLIATETPAGVGASREPQRWLEPGDEVTVEIEGVGALANPVTSVGN